MADRSETELSPSQQAHDGLGHGVTGSWTAIVGSQLTCSDASGFRVQLNPKLCTCALMHGAKGCKGKHGGNFQTTSPGVRAWLICVHAPMQAAALLSYSVQGVACSQPCVPARHCGHHCPVRPPAPYLSSNGFWDMSQLGKDVNSHAFSRATAYTQHLNACQA